MYELKKQPESKLNTYPESKLNTYPERESLVLVYNIYGCPPDMDVRIGNFTQSKLEVN